MPLAALRLAILAIASLAAIAGNAAVASFIPTGDGVAAASIEAIYFGPDSVTLDEHDIVHISSFLGTPHDNPGIVIRLRGYRDNLGSTSYELAIGQKRVDAVRTVLLSFGFAPGKIRTEILGDHDNDAPVCQDDDCRKQSRRVDILLQ